MSMLSMPRCWNRETKPHRFCPGCGHGIVLKALGLAIDELGTEDRVNFACDIGCSLLAWDFFNFPSLQTHHGRTLPVMTGMKKSAPDKIVVAYMGDGGGYSIGLQHLVSAALRDDPITVILVNNTVYAMTGGQMAPTTLTGQITETSPFGRREEETGQPIKGPETLKMLVHARAYLARGTVSQVRCLKISLTRALKTQMAGHFSLVEALSTCPTNWRTNAAATWSFLEHEMRDYYSCGEYSGQEVEQ